MTRKHLATLLGVLASLSALATLPPISNYASGTAAYQVKNGVSTLVGEDDNPWGLVFVSVVAAVILIMIAATALTLLGKYRAAGRAYAVGAVVGLPIVVPAVLSFIACQSIKRFRADLGENDPPAGS